MSKIYKTRDEQREIIIDAALSLVEKKHTILVTRRQIATQAKVSPAYISHIFGNMQGLRKSVIERAVQVENLPVLAQAIASNEHSVKHIPNGLRRKALGVL